MPIMLAGAAELADGLRAPQGRRFSVRRSTLEAELDSLVERYGEAEVAAVFEARRKKPRGRPSRNYVPHLVEMALTIAFAAQSRAPYIRAARQPLQLKAAGGADSSLMSAIIATRE